MTAFCSTRWDTFDYSVIPPFLVQSRQHRLHYNTTSYTIGASITNCTKLLFILKMEAIILCYCYKYVNNEFIDICPSPTKEKSHHISNHFTTTFIIRPSCTEKYCTVAKIYCHKMVCFFPCFTLFY